MLRGPRNRDLVAESVVEAESFQYDFVVIAREAPLGDLADRRPGRLLYVPNGSRQRDVAYAICECRRKVQLAVHTAPGEQVCEFRAVVNSSRFEWERLRRIFPVGREAARQQLDGLSESRLARVVGAHQDSQRGDLDLDPLCVAFVPLDAESSEFHSGAP